MIREVLPKTTVNSVFDILLRSQLDILSSRIVEDKVLEKALMSEVGSCN
jgi:hypothetical protein